MFEKNEEPEINNKQQSILKQIITRGGGIKINAARHSEFSDNITSTTTWTGSQFQTQPQSKLIYVLWSISTALGHNLANL